MTNMYYFDN